MEVTAQEKMEIIAQELETMVDGMRAAIIIERSAASKEDTEIAIEYWNCFCITYQRSMMELDKLIPEDPLYWQMEHQHAQTCIKQYNKIVQLVKEQKQSKLYPHLLNHQTAASKITDFEFWNDWLPALDYTCTESQRDAREIFSAQEAI